MRMAGAKFHSGVIQRTGCINPGSGTGPAGRVLSTIAGKGQASAFSRRINPQGIALAVLNMAVWLQRNGERHRNTDRSRTFRTGPAEDECS